MTTPTGTISMYDVRVELGLSGQISLNDSAVRNLAAKGSGTISLNDLRGKSAIDQVADPLTIPGNISGINAPISLNFTFNFTEGAGSFTSYSIYVFVNGEPTEIYASRHTPTYINGPTGATVTVNNGDLIEIDSMIVATAGETASQTCTVYVRNGSDGNTILGNALTYAFDDQTGGGVGGGEV